MGAARAYRRDCLGSALAFAAELVFCHSPRFYSRYFTAEIALMRLGFRR
ncbi:hypothetical protein CAMGR0001_2531 [Campylobacter gracilis RM3268]|uniref:Uncharacterized protein n=1 Tax=Campylobacter gracilis RM3268 TaxID=553220 RepID=C8PEP2_9BACT|nr:hypothetical protein CAMGR0001_2531 [Campylobacter gracilis RM3268]